MTAISLQSGSNGNCYYVESNGTKLLFDAGITASMAARRLEEHGRDIKDVDALIISHDHGDHARHTGVYSRKYKMPVYITQRTYEAAAKKHGIGRMNDVCHFRTGDVIGIGGISIETIPSPHDSADGSLFIISSEGKRLGIWTDLGHVRDELYPLVSTLDGLFIESNYDPLMLDNGPYPAFLKQRIKGPEGHLSNIDCAELLQAGTKLQWACLAHISNNNNSPETALETNRRIAGDSIQLYTANRYLSTEALTI
jgi:phosphoribosyl 1,2-cyclic phosphodiesterase